MKRIVFSALMLLIPIGALEIVCYFVTAHFESDFFSYEREFFKNLEEAEFTRFVNSEYFDPQLAWNNPVSPTKTIRKNCAGETIEYNYRDRRRVTPGLSKGQAVVAIFGESYAQGEEVPDESTIASVLTLKYGVPTENYGVNAYDPLQALGKFKASLPDLTGAKVAVLLVMHENIWRVVNSFKPVYFPVKSDYDFGLKPYARNGKIVPLNYPAGFGEFLREAKIRFREDYWVKPERGFPYSVSLARALFSNAVISRIWARIRGPFVYEYQFNTETRAGLTAALEEFVSVANSAMIRPVVIFVPRNSKSYGSSRTFVQSMNERWGREIAHEFSDAEVDWAKYRLSENRDYCHPSVYGYGRISLFIRGVVNRELIQSGVRIRGGGSQRSQPTGT